MVKKAEGKGRKSEQYWKEKKKRWKKDVKEEDSEVN